jgi:hypothetical protein
MKYQWLHDVPQQEYEDNLVDIVMHARPYECEKLAATGSDDLVALAIAVNPLTRAELWDTPSEEMKAFVEFYDSWSVGVNEAATARMVRTVCHNVTEWWYRREAREFVDELIASVQGGEGV